MVLLPDDWVKVFVMSVRPSGTTCLPLEGYSRNVYWSIFRKYVGKVQYATARQATNYNTTRRMRFASCVNKDTDTQSECVILMAFPWPTMDMRKRLIVSFTRICLSC